MSPPLASIVIIEDETLLRRLLIEALRRDTSYAIVGEASHAGEGLEICQSLRPDIVLLDINLPGGASGADLARLLRRDLPEIRLIVISSSQDPIVVSRILQMGIHAFVDKNQIADAVRIAIREVREGRSYFTGIAARLIAQAPSELSPSESHDPIGTSSDLTDREMEILRLVAAGRTSRAISIELFISEATVKKHRVNLMRKLGIHDVAGLTRYVMEKGL